MSVRVQRWPLHPQPQAQESLSSWFARLAHTYNLTVDNLAHLGLERTVGSPRELDRDPPLRLLQMLGKRTGISVARLRTMTLRGYVPWILDTLDTQDRDCLPTYAAQYRVLLPRAAQSTVDHHWNSMTKTYCLPWLIEQRRGEEQVCAQCLLTDPIPYHRIFWRLGLMGSCPFHGCLLHLRRRYLEPWRPVDPPLPEPAHANLLVVDRLTYQAVTTGTVCLSERDCMSAAVYVRFLRSLVQELFSTAAAVGKNVQTLDQLWEHAGAPDWMTRGQLLPFELLPLEIRQVALQVVGWLLRDWPASLAPWQPVKFAKDGRYRSLPMVIAEGLQRTRCQDNPELQPPRNRRATTKTRAPLPPRVPYSHLVLQLLHALRTDDHEATRYARMLIRGGMSEAGAWEQVAIVRHTPLVELYRRCVPRVLCGSGAD